MNDDKELFNLIVKTLEDLHTKEQKLFDKETSERSIAFHFARILYNYLTSSSYSNYNLDFEYNRSTDENNEFLRLVKKIQYEGKEAKVFPDVIIHRRGEDDNLLVIEIKCKGNHDKKGYENDKWKLRAFTSQCEMNKYKYKYGMHIILSKKSSIIQIYENGEEKGEKIFINEK